jgi:hypothetical protein
MTSNVAIGTVAPAINAAPSDHFAGVLNPAKINGGTPIDGDRPLMAAGLGRPNRPATPAARMKDWSETLKTRVAPGATTPAGFGKVRVISAPTQNKNTSVPALFNKDGKTWKVPGLPALEGQIKGELMVGLDRALTPQRVQVFQGLSEGQQITARTLIGAALEAMGLPAGSAGRIDPKHMDMVVAAALKYAQQTPTALDAAAKPGARTPTTRPVKPAPPVPTARTPTTQQVLPAPTARMPTSPAGGLRETSRQPRSTERKAQARGDTDTVSVLAGTDLVRQQRLTADATKKLGEARAALGREVGRPADAIPPRTAALKVLSDYWTARATSDPAAFDKARDAQDALTQRMKPLRQEAAAGSALAKVRQDYRTTIDSIRQLNPAFDAAAIGGARINETTLAELEPKMPPEAFAKLELETAQRYLAHFQADAAAKPNSPAHTQAAEAFLASVSRPTRERWELSLIGGPTLQEVVQREAKAGGELTVARINRAVLSETRIGPPKLPENTANVVANQFYEIRYGNATEFTAKLVRALSPRYELTMHVRAADGSRHLQIYRHGSERGGTTIIDQRDGAALAQPNGLVSAISEALNVKPSDRGAIVVSYGSSPKVMRDETTIYRVATQTERKDIANRWAAERRVTPQQRLATLESDYASFQRSFESASFEPDRARGKAQLELLLEHMKVSAAALRRDAPGPIAERAEELAHAAKVFVGIQNYSPVGKWARSIEAERGRNPPAPGQTVTQRWLATVNDLMRRHGVPEEYCRNLRWQAQVLESVADDIHSMQQQNPAGFSPVFGDEAGKNISVERRRQIVSSPTTYLNYLATSRPAWENLKSSIGLTDEIWLDQLYVEANNGGVLKPAQLDKMAGHYGNRVIAKALASARATKGLGILEQDFSNQLSSPPAVLRANRPKYTGFVLKMNEQPFRRVLQRGPFANVNLTDESMKARTLDLIGAVERHLHAHRSPAAVQSALDLIDASVRRMTELGDTAQSGIPEQSVHMLRNFRSLVERLGPASP